LPPPQVWQVSQSVSAAHGRPTHSDVAAAHRSPAAQLESSAHQRA
jgi:hypothetical protein